MTKQTLQIGFMFLIIAVTFMIGMHFGNNNKETEKTINKLVAQAMFNQQSENKTILVMYKKDQEKRILEYDKYGNSIVCGLPFQSIDTSNSKADVDYLIKWDELEDSFTIEGKLLPTQKTELYSFLGR